MTQPTEPTRPTQPSQSTKLTASGLTISVGAVTDVGLKRQVNEDAHLVLPAAYIVADGMGGYEAGEHASAAVVEAFRQVATGLESLDLGQVTAALDLADDGVAAVAGGTARGAGSTVVGAVLVTTDGEPSWLVFNVGDSRAYRHAGTVLEQITVDHSLGQELYAAGQITAAELDAFPDRNVITRAIGASDASADSWSMPVRNGERLLLCSDGLSGEVSAEVIRDTLSRFDDPQAAAAELVELAKLAGGKDNITAIVVDVIAGGRDFGAGDLGRVDASRRDDEDAEIDETTAPVRARS